MVANWVRNGNIGEMDMKRTIRFIWAAAICLLSACTATDLVTPQQTAVEDDVTNTKKSVLIRVRVTDNPVTKVTVEPVAQKSSVNQYHYKFEDNDVLVIKAVDSERSDISGELKYEGEDLGFSGELTYEGSLDNVELSAHLDNGFTGDYSSAVEATIEKAVHSFSDFSTTFYYAQTKADAAKEVSVQLEQASTFVIFALTLADDDALDGDYSMSISDENHTGLTTGSVTVKDGSARFVVAYKGGQELDKASVTLSKNDVDRKAFFCSKGKTTLEANKNYTVTRTNIPVVGDAYYSDGTFGHYAHAQNATPTGIVVYVNDGGEYDDAITEGGKALVMALKACPNPRYNNKWRWGNNYTAEEDYSLLGNAVTNVAEAKVDFGGKAKTDRMVDNDCEIAKAARSYGEDWFVPAAGQWVVILGPKGIGKGKPMDEWRNGDDEEWTKLGNVARILEGEATLINIINSAMSDVSEDYTPFVAAENYWTSSERDYKHAIRTNIGGDTGWSVMKIHGDKIKNMAMLVRPFLAIPQDN